MNNIYEKIIKKGYCIVPFKHHPKKIKDAIRNSKFRPMAKECFANAQKLVSRQLNPDFYYAEGIVVSSIGFPFEHAWIIDENDINYDITLNPMPKIICYKKYTFKDVLANMRKTMYYTSINPNWLNTMQTAFIMGIPIDLEVEKIKEKINESFNALKDLNAKSQGLKCT